MPSLAQRLLALVLAALLPGCLANSYVIPREAARALVQQPPETRGADVRVVQRIFADEPVSAPPVNATTQVVFVPQGQISVGVGGGGCVDPGGRVVPCGGRAMGPAPGGGGTFVGGTGGGGTVAVQPAGGAGVAAVQPGTGAGTVGVQPAPGGSAAASGGARGGGASGGGGSSSGGGSGDGLAVVLIIAASAIVALVLAGTEGARYDGWAQLHPMHPVHVLGQNGSVGVVPLAQLDAATVEASEELIVSENEGPFVRLGRAPLDRVGLAYGMEAGTATLRGRRGPVGAGFASHIQFGGFPLHGLGLLFDALLGVGDENAQSIVNAQLSGEVQVIPFGVGLFEFGAFARVGGASPAQAGDAWGLAVGGGVLAQLALTTRLALTVRGGLHWVNDAREDVLGGEGTIGLAIY
jgi:hypothetical protein